MASGQLTRVEALWEYFPELQQQRGKCGFGTDPDRLGRVGTLQVPCWLVDPVMCLHSKAEDPQYLAIGLYQACCFLFSRLAIAIGVPDQKHGRPR